MTTALASDFAGLASNRDRLLQLLKDGQWHDQHACTEAGGMRYSARVKELRAQGYRIETQRLEPRRFFYRLIAPAQGRLF